MKAIEIKIRLHAPASGAVLNNISRLLERYLKHKEIEFRSIDVRAKLDDNE